MNSEPTDLDKHRGMAARKAVSIRRVLAEVEKNARELRDRQAMLESQLLSTPADSWPEAARNHWRFIAAAVDGGLPRPAGRK